MTLDGRHDAYSELYGKYRRISCICDSASVCGNCRGTSVDPLPWTEIFDLLQPAWRERRDHARRILRSG